MPEVLKFEDAIAETDDGGRSLLIGNGFSPRSFTYGNLLRASRLVEDTPIRKLFEWLDTVDFEEVIRAVENAAVVADAYDNAAHLKELRSASDDVRLALVTAVRTIHPEYAGLDFGPPAEFLKKFKKVFSLNYDLLLYWSTLANENERVFSDGFGLGTKNGNFQGPWEIDAHCSIYNLHGGLHLFERQGDKIEKHLNLNDLTGLEDTIINNKRLPLCIAEGTWRKKLRKINSVPYLKHCYNKLKENADCLFIYGHSAHKNDSHIYHAVFNSKVKRVFFGVYEPNTENLEAFDAKLAKFQELGDNSISYKFFDAGSANVWRA